MAETGDKIGAAVPFRALLRLGAKRCGVEKQQVPKRQQPPLDERKPQLGLLAIDLDRVPRHHKGIERADIVVVEPGEMVVRKGRVETLAAPRDALAHGAAKRLLRPAADA